MDRERVIEWAAKVVALRDKVAEADAEVEHFDACLEVANANLAEAKALLSVAVGELARGGSGGWERHADYPPERVSEVNRKWRWRMDVGFEEVEYLYRSPVYASLGLELGVGTQDTHVPPSGKEYKCMWLTVEEHVTILALANERYPKGDE